MSKKLNLISYFARLSGVIEDSDKKEEVFFMEEEGKEINEMDNDACG